MGRKISYLYYKKRLAVSLFTLNTGITRVTFYFLKGKSIRNKYYILLKKN